MKIPTLLCIALICILEVVIVVAVVRSAHHSVDCEDSQGHMLCTP